MITRKAVYKLTIFVLIPFIGWAALSVMFQRTAAPDTHMKLTQEQSSVDIQEQAVTSVVQKSLSEPPPSGYASIPPGVQILSVKIQKDSIIFNFSKELLSHGAGSELEDALHQIFVKLGNEVPHIMKDKGYTVLIEGVPLEQYLD
jgi:hypothetical protein